MSTGPPYALIVTAGLRLYEAHPTALSESGQTVLRFETVSDEPRNGDDGMGARETCEASAVLLGLDGEVCARAKAVVAA